VSSGEPPPFEFAPALGDPPEAAQAEVAVPQTLGRAGGYELLIELASGGMATVYLGRAVDGREGAMLVAIKRPHKHLATDKMFMSMLLDEARLASAIDHQNVVKVRELGFEGGEPFIVMDYVEGASLAELRKELATVERAVDARVAVRVILDALEGLIAAHELRDDGGRHLGIIHRDVSPHNVLVGCDGRGRLTDFGIAKAEDRVQVTRTHEVKGKLAYLAPERIDKRRTCTVQSDVFSMAVVLWECIAGRRLFRGEEAVETLQEVMSAPIPRLRRLGARIPVALDDVIARGLSRDLETRYLTARDFAEAVERAAGRHNIASATEVANVIETVFGPRMRVRHENIRESLRGRDADEIIIQSGLPARPPPTNEMRLSVPEALAQIAPPAPSARYTFGNNDYAAKMFPSRKLPWGIIAGVGGGVMVGAIVVFVLVPRAAAPIAALPTATVAPPPKARHLRVALPFVCSLVTLDDSARELDPASDAVEFDVQGDRPTRHRVIAVAVDGTRGEGWVNEVDGVAQVEEEGYSFESPDFPTPAQPPPVTSAAPPGQRASAPPRSGGLAGKRLPPPPPPPPPNKNGFTKLK
jgi:eukaryotic-like serine/threonine-protein kinase